MCCVLEGLCDVVAHCTEEYRNDSHRRFQSLRRGASAEGGQKGTGKETVGLRHGSALPMAATEGSDASAPPTHSTLHRVFTGDLMARSCAVCRLVTASRTRRTQLQPQTIRRLPSLGSSSRWNRSSALCSTKRSSRHLRSTIRRDQNAPTA